MAYQAGSDKQLSEKAIEILKNSKPCIAKCECTIFSKDDPSISVTPMKIEQMTIIQNFETAYSDVITLTVSVTSDEAILILSNYKNLQCTLVFNRYDELLKLQPDILPQIENYVVIISNATDLLKQFTKAEMTSTQNAGESSAGERLPSESVLSRRFNLDIQLIDEDVYKRRDRPFNFILQNTSMVNAIHYIANLLEIKDVKCQSVDNERTYENFVIPPMQSLSTIFDYLQEHFGVYSKGLSSYYTHNVLYVYPSFNVKPDVENIINLYKQQDNTYIGCPSYHCEEGNEVSILLNGKVAMENLSEKSTDEIGNYHVSLRAESIHDVGKEFNGRECTIRDNNLLSIAAENAKQAQTDKVSARYMQATNNAYTMSSAMSQFMCKVLAAEWQYAWPYTIKPGSKVVYHYEDMNGVKTSEGIICSVVYNMKLNTTRGLTGKDNFYSFAAAISARLTSDTDTSDVFSLGDFSSLKRILYNE